MQVTRRSNISELEVTTVTANCDNDSVTDSLSRPVYVGINYHGNQTLDNNDTREHDGRNHSDISQRHGHEQNNNLPFVFHFGRADRSIRVNTRSRTFVNGYSRRSGT